MTQIGHGDERVAEALAAQARKLAAEPTRLFHNPRVESYFDRLCALASNGFTKAWTISGRTEAVENSVKLAFQRHRANPPRAPKALLPHTAIANSCSSGTMRATTRSSAVLFAAFMYRYISRSPVEHGLLIPPGLRPPWGTPTDAH